MLTNPLQIMFTPAQLLEKVNAALAALPLPAAPGGLYAPIAYDLASGGKRLRPVLLLMAYNLYRHDVEPAMPAAVGLEIYHNHTLLHDDLMDNADVRRGRPTVHRRAEKNCIFVDNRRCGRNVGRPDRPDKCSPRKNDRYDRNFYRYDRKNGDSTC